MEYTDLSNFKTTFDPLTNPDKRFKKIFEDEYARVIFAGYRLNHIIDGDSLEKLKRYSLIIADEIRGGKLKLETDSLKKRLRLIEFLCLDDINDEFVNYLLPYLKREKDFGYTYTSKSA